MLCGRNHEGRSVTKCLLRLIQDSWIKEYTPDDDWTTALMIIHFKVISGVKFGCIYIDISLLSVILNRLRQYIANDMFQDVSRYYKNHNVIFDQNSVPWTWYFLYGNSKCIEQGSIFIKSLTIGQRHLSNSIGLHGGKCLKSWIDQ